MKANHNSSFTTDSSIDVVAYPSKNTNWKRITTLTMITRPINQLLLILLKIQIESESQPQEYCELTGKVVAYPSKNTNWKRITTNQYSYRRGSKLLLILLKIQIESESQHSVFTDLISGVVAYPSKNTNWKRITTTDFDSLTDSSCCLSF